MRPAEAQGPPPSLFQVVHRAVEVADPSGRYGVGDLLRYVEDSDEPITAHADIETDLAELKGRVDPQDEDPAVMMAIAVATYLAFKRDEVTRFEQACASLGIRHRLLRPHAPESNGKVERFIKTIDDECLAIQQPRTCTARTGVVDAFVWYYNYQRPHLSLAGQTPVQRRQAYLAKARLLS